MRLENTRIEFSEDDEFLTVTLPVNRRSALVLFYSVLLVIWVVMLGVTIYFLVRPLLPATVQLSFGYLFTWYLIVIVWLVLWVRYVGRTVWRGWLFSVAYEETLFINQDRFAVVRQAVVRGLSDAYDMRYMSPFYLHEKHNCPAFQYGKAHHHLFGQGLNSAEATTLIAFLNRRFFPFADDDSEDDMLD
ncbi:MAG: hypothetical protein M9930_20315 [Anaerolineae bacterium]|nr:hypothetical protein [Anaerolineae bacterium]